MNKLCCCISILGLFMIMVESVLAAPPGSKNFSHFDYTPNRAMHDSHHGIKSQQREYYTRYPADSLPLQTGTALPENFPVAQRQVDYSINPKLSEPTRYQQWIKVKNKFVLLNVLTNTVIKVVSDEDPSQN